MFCWVSVVVAVWADGGGQFSSCSREGGDGEAGAAAAAGVIADAGAAAADGAEVSAGGGARKAPVGTVAVVVVSGDKGCAARWRDTSSRTERLALDMVLY